MKLRLRSGWIVCDQDGSLRIRLRDVSSYACGPADPSVTCVWVAGRRYPHELHGNHVDLLDVYFADPRNFTDPRSL